MRFLNPLGLLGLFAVPIIIGLHLHLERNRRVLVSSMFLWQFLDAKFQGQKPRFVRFTWLLLLDILLAVLFSLALAKPQVTLPALGGNAVQKVILLDDSISMLARDGQPDRFSLAKEIAVNLIQGVSRRDEVLVMTIGGEVDLVGTSDESGSRTLVQDVNDLVSDGFGTMLRTGLAQASLFSNPELPMEVYVITDGAYAPEEFDDFPYQIIWAFIGFEVNNQAVLTPVLETQNDGSVSLFARVNNFSTHQSERDVEIWVNGEVFRQERVSLAANSSVPISEILPANTQSVEVRLLGEDALPEDDLGVAARLQDNVVQVALVTSQTQGDLTRAVSAVPDARLTVYAPEDILPEIIYDLILYQGVVPQQWPRGTVAVFDPPVQNDLFSLGEEKIITTPITVQDHPVLEGVSLSNVRWETGPDFSGATRSDERELPAVQTLAQDADQPILVDLIFTDGDKFVFLPRLGSGNFIQNSAFPIFIRNLIEFSRDFSGNGAALLGEQIQIGGQLVSEEMMVQYPGEDGFQSVASVAGKFDQVGLYTFQYTDALGDDREFSVGVNAGELSESDIAPQEWRFAVESGQMDQEIERQTIDVNLSPWLLLVAVLLLVLEAWRAWR